MMFKTRNLFLTSGVLFALGIFLVAFGPRNGCPSALKINDVTFNLECAMTDAAREQGLSGREGLATSTGMLFVFDKPGEYQFWMKDMKFPLDIIWFDQDKKVVFVEENTTPESYPHSFGPAVPAKYVLEIDAGLVRQLGIRVGDLAEF